MKWFLILIFLFFICCESITKRKNKFPDDGPVSVSRYEVSDGAILSVDPEMGGNGFEEIADDLGFVTSSFYDPYESQKAVKGGVFRFPIFQYPKTLSPIGKDSFWEVSVYLNSLVFETLLVKDPSLEGGYCPSLASHWKIDNEKGKYTFRIDPLARWSDGSRVTAEDVKFSLELIKNPKTESLFENNFFKEFSAKIISPYIIEITTSNKNWRSFSKISTFMYILQKREIEKNSIDTFIYRYKNCQPVGSGPYIINPFNINEGKSFEFRRRKDYWGYKKGFWEKTGNFDKIELKVFQSDFICKDSFKHDNIDILPVPRTDWWKSEFDRENPSLSFSCLKRGVVKKRKVFNNLPKSSFRIDLNTRVKPLDNIEVRKAIAHLFNREYIIDKLFNNEYTPTPSIYVSGEYASKNITPVKYNFHLADSLLKRNGWNMVDGFRVKDGKRFSISILESEYSSKFVSFFKNDLKKAGIDLKIESVDRDEISDRVYSKSFDMVVSYWKNTDIPSPGFFLHSSTSDIENTNNITGFKSSYVDSLIELYNEEYDFKNRKRYIQQIDEEYYNQYHSIMGWYSSYSERILYWDRFGTPKNILGFDGDYYSSLYFWWADKSKEKLVNKAIKNENIIFDLGDENSYFSQ
ncbi:MAG: hypothetical protein CR982_07415 [Candidatus Cloacimonadota bacterium]|nr:MAG: hypothetical protein CR982_07415 [Candidatus Cloacimonadota bacterium]PIE80161.1 MAG: hypothetical protein CSA15_02060 [Candidatus Delongbacteria bacterium]